MDTRKAVKAAKASGDNDETSDARSIRAWLQFSTFEDRFNTTSIWPHGAHASAQLLSKPGQALNQLRLDCVTSKGFSGRRL